ncbi:hypothetical protein R6Q59_005723 [Mikania micrantha]|uniref:DUF4378 domain-containing protein n=1 Tax=Mikania micrantha TaxID=192012 RepID=A0A5N6PWL0_9ASTR|nr:hypothetical protein E3N88_05020 [Mikania micrantha]
MNDSESVKSSSLVVAEKKPRRNGGCIGIFFQLFDWNRRFTKKKLFSKRLLPPDRTKEGSKKFGGDDKLPRSRLIADENSGGFPNKNKTGANRVQTPSLVARLMGLESMPPVNHDQPPGEFREKVVGEIGEFRPPKVQKTGLVDRRSVTRFGAEALQLKNVLSQSRKHHHPKLASPVKSTSHHAKRNTSRLMGAATRILEPGLHARNKSKYVITNGRGASNAPRPLGNRLRSDKCGDVDKEIVKTSCKTCGNLIDVVEPTSNQHSPSTFQKENNRDQLKLNCFSFGSDTKDFVALNRGSSGGTRSRVPVKVEVMKFENARVNSLSARQNRQVTYTRKKGKSCSIVGSSANVPKMVKNAQSSKKQTRSDDWQPDYQGHIMTKNSDDGMTFRFSSQMKNPNALPFKTNSRKRFASNPSHEKIRFCLQTIKSEKVSIIGGKNNRSSLGSVLEASFSNESCCSSSLEDSSVHTQHADSMSYSYDDESQFQESEMDRLYSDLPLRKEDTHNKLVANLLTYISQVLCSMDLVSFRTNRNIKEVIFNSELVLGNQIPHNPNEMNSFFICDLILELDTLADVMRTTFGSFLGSHNSNARYQLKRFVFDSLIEYLELKYVQYAKCGFRSWMSLPQFMGFDSLILEVVEEVRRWMGVTSGELMLRMDMSHGSGKWSDFEIEAYETGAIVELDIVQTLIDELVIDVSTGIGLFRV